jgi:hypothetical protein
MCFCKAKSGGICVFVRLSLVVYVFLFVDTPHSSKIWRLLIILWSSFAILQISRIILSTSIYNVFINITCMCIEITKQTDLWININENILNIIKHWYITVQTILRRNINAKSGGICVFVRLSLVIYVFL